MTPWRQRNDRNVTAFCCGFDDTILPGTGRWQGEALTEGGLLIGHTFRHAPSTMLRMVPLPVPGRNKKGPGSLGCPALFLPIPGDQRAMPPAASTASVTRSPAVEVIGAICTGFSMPISIGPIMLSPPSSRSSLAEMFAD
jgi:hypothetical protein